MHICVSSSRTSPSPAVSVPRPTPFRSHTRRPVVSPTSVVSSTTVFARSKNTARPSLSSAAAAHRGHHHERLRVPCVPISPFAIVVSLHQSAPDMCRIMRIVLTCAPIILVRIKLRPRCILALKRTGQRLLSALLHHGQGQQDPLRGRAGLRLLLSHYPSVRILPGVQSSHELCVERLEAFGL